MKSAHRSRGLAPSGLRPKSLSLPVLERIMDVGDSRRRRQAALERGALLISGLKVDPRYFYLVKQIMLINEQIIEKVTTEKTCFFRRFPKRSVVFNLSIDREDYCAYILKYVHNRLLFNRPSTS